MMFSVLMSLLLVGSLATKDCPAGEEDKDTAGTCVPCEAGSFKAAAGATMCSPKVPQDAAVCTGLHREAPGANVATVLDKDDSVCGACKAGYTTAGGTDDAVPTADCDKCAAGFGSTTTSDDDCAACDAATTFSAVITDFRTVCGDKTADTCGTGTIAEPKKVITGDSTTDAACGCSAGKYDTDCAETCAKDTFLAEGLNQAKTECTAHKKCDSKADPKEYGIKTAGDTTKDNVCNMSPTTTKPSSAAALAFTALTLFAMLF